MNEKRKFSRKTVWLAMDSDYGTRLNEIAAERIRLTRQISDYRNVGRSVYEYSLFRIYELDAERDTILSLFEVY